MDRSTGTIFRDVLFLILAAFVVMVVLLFPHINERGEQEISEIDAPGSVIITITWDYEFNSDVDLWVKAPRMRPVGYSNKGGPVFNLLRDDLGSSTHTDITKINHEVAYTRGTPKGEYIVNAHLFRVVDSKVPVEVLVTAAVKLSASATLTKLVNTTIKLRFQKEELTAFRFELDENGSLVKGSIHAVYEPLREYTGK